jgi:hypothetical protein
MPGTNARATEFPKGNRVGRAPWLGPWPAWDALVPLFLL